MSSAGDENVCMAGDENLKLTEESLQSITLGIRAALDELKDIGTATEALNGAGLSDLSLSGMEAGHGGLAGDFEAFCELWDWGVRGLMQDADQLAQRAGLAAGMTWEEDRYVEGTFKVAANAVIGNPHATEEEVEQQSWGEVLGAQGRGSGADERWQQLGADQPDGS
ncbi:hypothetical protein [Streptomyces zagrosensis]|uniref:Uncharacterized protein n=1 Tax=Streptomyces zagrosensis TaxID=1042984 RepID=A0A7W9QD37_9ACTN|nr:hypothetical protein [Streptomyces zagrosensis]MBB5938063.1 hypothetical protein [Streptomyces zagrosensis]